MFEVFEVPEASENPKGHGRLSMRGIDLIYTSGFAVFTRKLSLHLQVGFESFTSEFALVAVF